MIFINTVLDFVSAKSPPMRVIDVDHQSDRVVLLDIESKTALPEIRPLSEVKESFQQGHVKIVAPDPYVQVIHIHDKDLSDRKISIRNRAHEIISWMINENKWGLYSRKSRGLLTASASLQFHVTEKTILKFFRRYFQRGMVPNALLPDFDLCGAPGKPKPESSIKRGRPSTLEKVDGKRTGFIVTTEMKFLMNKFYKKLVLKDCLPVPKAYTQFLHDNFSLEQNFEENGIVTLTLPPQSEYPSRDMFLYWGTKELTNTEIAQANFGHDYNLQARPLLSKSTAIATGPGTGQVDANIGDILLRSYLNQHRLIGKPVFYLVRDTWSGMMVGFACTLEGPSWEGARLALASVVEDKVSLCARYGLTIEPEDWPCHHQFSKYIADRGELLGEQAYTADKSLKIEISNTSPFRGDNKALVERSFRVINDETLHWLPGTTYLREHRTGHDFRNDDKLNIKQLAKIILKNIIHQNNNHIRKNFQPEIGMIEDDVPRIARDIYLWGLENKSGALRTADPEAVRLALLPRTQGSVGREGTYVNQIWYTSNDPRLLEYIHRKPGSRQAVTISHDPTCIDTVRVHLENPTAVIPCSLRLDYQVYAGATLPEHRDRLAIQIQKEQRLTSSTDVAKINQYAEVQDIVGEPQIEGAQEDPVSMRQARKEENAAWNKTTQGKGPDAETPQLSEANAKDDYRPTFNLSKQIRKAINKENPDE
jgi:putative transposase